MKKHVLIINLLRNSISLLKVPFLALLFFNFSVLLLQASIIETPHFHEIAQYASPDTLLIVDIDDTLLIPQQTLGTDVWFLHRVTQNEGLGLSKTDAFEKSLAEWEAVRHVTKVKIVEDGTDKVIADLQKKGIPLIGLTTQGLALSTRTLQQLSSLNIHLTKTAPSLEDHYFINGHGVLYRQGLLFTSGTPKGQALLKLLDKIGYLPKRIVFINDKKKHLKDVEEAVTALGIEFIGLRYSYSDKRVADFNKELADVQWKYSTFDHILSNEEAEKILNDNKKGQ